MRITLDLRKTLEQNAAEYYDKSKKAKLKLEGAMKAIEDTRKRIHDLETKWKEEEESHKAEKRPERKVEWYEKYRWFITSSGFLVIAGRDATTNEGIIKKRTETGDVVFHTSMSGSPFAVIKTKGKTPDDKSINETAQFVAAYSRAWRLGMGSLEVFYVDPDQVSKEAPSGEYISKGAFMIYGKKNTVDAGLKLFVGMDSHGRIMAGPEDAVKKACEKHVEIVQGKEKISETAKKVKHILGGDLDEIMKVIPAGGAQVKGEAR